MVVYLRLQVEQGNLMSNEFNYNPEELTDGVKLLLDNFNLNEEYSDKNDMLRIKLNDFIVDYKTYFAENGKIGDRCRNLSSWKNVISECFESVPHIDYFNTLMQYHNNGCRSHLDPDKVELTESGIVYTISWNDSCHCHPDYRDEEILIPFGDLNLTIDEYRQKLINKRDAKKALEAQKEAAKEAKDKADRLEREKAQYEKLKAKFESQV